MPEMSVGNSHSPMILLGVPRLTKRSDLHLSHSPIAVPRSQIPMGIGGLGTRPRWDWDWDGTTERGNRNSNYERK
jgi:hypothetical protein